MHPDSIETLAREHTTAVFALARRVRTRWRAGTPWGDLVGSAFVGVCEAHQRFDPARGVKFWSFAYTRVQGAILDGTGDRIGPGGPLIKRLARARRAAAIAQERERRALAAQEVAAAEEALARCAAASTCAALGLELGVLDDEEVEEDEEGDPRELVMDTDQPDQEQLLERASLGPQLHAEISTLPMIERIVVRGIYFEGRCLDDLGAELGVSRSWASRIHTRAIERLRARMTA